MTLEPTLAQAPFTLAQFYLNWDDSRQYEEEARHLLLKAIKLNPPFAAAQELLDYLEGVR